MAKKGHAKRTPDHQRLPLWKKALFGGIAVLLFFGFLEGVLALFGVKPLLFEDDPYVGFAAKIPLFVKEGDKMVTAKNKVKWFNEQSFPRKKAKDTVRIFCMGGSTTFGRPYRDKTSFCGWLREFLPAADASKGWEVVNAGGISYASYRVAALMEELAEDDPDLFVIYCGQNEFLERRTYADLIDMPAGVRGLQASLSKSRVYSLLSRVVKGGGLAKGASRLDTEVTTILDQSVGPEAYTRDAEWREQVLSHYRFNLARMVDIARASGAEVVFVMPASNLRNSSPFKSEHRKGLGEDDLAAWQAAYDKARSAFEAGDKVAATAAITQAVEIDPEHADTQYLQGRILEAAGDFIGAKMAYESALENDICPLRMVADMRAILSAVATGRGVPVVDFHRMMEAGAVHGIPGEDEFLDHVHPTIESHRLLALALVDALAGMGMAKVADGWDEAGATARVMARVDDNERGIALRNLANVLQWAGKYEDAYAAAKKSLELTPGDAYANFVTGDLAEKLGKTEEAMKQFRFLTGFDLNTEDAPYFVGAHYSYARLLTEAGDLAGSVRMLRKTLKLKSDHEGAAEALPNALQALATSLLQAGKGAEAVEPLQELLGLRSGDANVENWLGIALIQAARPEEAIPHLKKALAASPENPAAHNNLASAYAQTGDKIGAAKHFQETVRLNPGHFGAMANLGELYLEAGQLDAAERAFQRVLELQPGNAAAQARLTQIRERKAH